MSAVLVTGGLVALPVAFFALRAWMQPKPIPGIPHNPIKSIWGDIIGIAQAQKELDAGVTGYILPEAKRLGPICQMVLGPFGNLVVLTDPQEMEDVILRRSKSHDTSPRSTSVTGGLIPFSQASMQTTPDWKRHRRLVGPSMTPRYLKYMTPRITSNIDQLIRYWRDKMRAVVENGGNCFATEVDFQFCTMDTIGEIVFGESFGCVTSVHESLHLGAPEVDHGTGGTTFPHLKGSPLHTATNILVHSLNSGFNVPIITLPIYWLVTKLTPKWRSAYTLLSQFIYRRIALAKTRANDMRAQGLTQDSAPDCVVDMVMENEKDTEGMSEKEIMDELLGLVIAGQDTTSSALSFGLKFLSNNPEVQIKLRKELLANLDNPLGRPLTYDEVASQNGVLPYLEAVAAEILRCGRVAPGFSRQVTTDDMVILGHAIPKGTNILFLAALPGLEGDKNYGARTAHDLNEVRSEKSKAQGLSRGWWDDGDSTVFKPERWLVEEVRESGETVMKFDPKRGVSFQFGLGQRACFGAKLATLELKLVIASLTLAFFFDRVPKELDGFETRELLLIHPKTAYAAPKEWPADS